MATKLLLTDVAASCVKQIPSNYIRPISDRPNFSEVERSGSIPLVDLEGLHSHRRSEIIMQIGQACQDYGFFLVRNHGVPEKMMNNALLMAKEFFKLPENGRMKYYSDDHRRSIRLSTTFNVKTEKVYSWRDFLRFHSNPLEDYVHEWPPNPPSFRKDVGEYCTGVRALVLRLLEAISESLGLEKDYINKALGKHGQHVSMNYYPPCPQPELTFGVPGHTDPTMITVLLPNEVPGLQVFKNGKWMAVNSVPNTFVINIGDQMQVLSNDRYKSVLHRAVVNCDKERISIATFYYPSLDATMGPAKELIDDDNPAAYRNHSFSEFYEKFWNRGLATECCLLDLFKSSVV